jgi:uncharacterized membrane protein YfcA
MAELSPQAWLLLALGALGIGVSKSGLAGVSLVHVLVFAVVFGARASTGILLPLLIVGDLAAVVIVGRDVQWGHVRRLLPPAVVGVVGGTLLLGRLDEAAFRPLIGGIILGLAAGQIVRMWRPDLLARVPHAAWFATIMGLITGVTTMLANAAGPVVALYLLAIALPKDRLVATGAWFFLVLNLLKVPFSAGLGLIDLRTLAVDVALAPLVVLGLCAGRWVVRRLPQRTFDTLLLAFTAVAAVRLVAAW